MNQRVIVILGLIVILLVGLTLLSGGGIRGLLSYQCRTTAEAIHVNWAWSMKGCFIQQPDGSWIPIDNYRNQSF